MPLAKAGGLGFANPLSLVRRGWACCSAVHVTRRVIGRDRFLAMKCRSWRIDTQKCRYRVKIVQLLPVKLVVALCFVAAAYENPSLKSC